MGYRRTRWAAGALAAVSIAAFVALPAPSSGASEGGLPPGQGSAFADTIKFDPRAGNLSIGVDVGKASANHQNSAAQAISQAIDLGTIGTSLAAYQCDGSAPSLPENKQPQPLIADTRTPDAPQQADEKETFAPGFEKSVQVTNDPSAKAVTTTAPFGLQGVAEVGGGVAQSTSGLEKGVRAAAATADISGLTLPGGIQLSSLHWEARFGSDGDPTGTFSIGSASIAGKPIPTNNPADTIKQLNAALNPFGLMLTAPTAHNTHGTMFVDSLALSVVPNPTRDSLFNTVLQGVQPTRESLFAALLKAKCTLSTEITVFDIALGSVTGAGSFNMLLGGAQASSSEVAANPFQLGFVGLGQNVETAGTPGSSFGTVSSNGGSAAGQPAAAAPAPKPSASNAVPAAATAPLSGKRGGMLAGLGLGSLALLAAVAEGDRRKMRRAQRMLPMED